MARQTITLERGSNEMNAQSKGAAILSEMGAHVEAAVAAKANTAASPEKKAAKAARSLAEALDGLVIEDFDNEPITGALEGLIEALTEQAPDAVDFSEGNDLATKIAGLLAAGEDFQPTGFDATEATTLLDAWKAASGRRSRGTGESQTPPSQMVPCPVKVTFTYPDGADLKLAKEITHESTWSSVSNEISKRARAIDGIEANAGYTRPESAKVQWQEATKSIKEGGNGGTVVVPTQHGDMIAVVEAVR